MSLSPPAAPRTIDTHTHFVPKSALGPAERGELWHGIQFGRNARGKFTSTVGAVSQEIPWPTPLETPQMRLASMAARRVDLHMVSISPTLYWYSVAPDEACRFARVTNDDLAEMVAGAPDRFVGLGYLPLQDVNGAIAELERCVTVHGYPGVMIGTNVNGTDWDDATLFPVLAAAAELGAVLYFHPARGRADPFLRRYHFSNLIGNPLETAVALGCLIFGGVFDRLPGLKTCFAHAGGYGVLGVGRLDHGQSVRPEGAGIARLPSDYVRACWFDTITHSERTLRYILDVAGADRVVLGSDYPADMGEPQPVDFIEGCASLTATEKTAILGGNAARLFGLAERARRT
jgi:aminocarboxymuconate-semialdehyde decarboxylase